MKLLLQLFKLLAGLWIVLLPWLENDSRMWVDVVTVIVGAILILMAIWNIVRIARRKHLVGDVT